jgi:predicted dehydrogenase
MKKNIHRRDFIAKSTQLGVVSFVGHKLIPPTVLGANEKVKLAIVGCGGRGRYVARGLVEQGARLTHVCDVNSEKMDELVKFVSDVQDEKPKKIKDMRTVLEDNNVDAVAIATPDHWHAIQTVWTCQAGKDVFVEKPHANSIVESHKMVEAAEKYKRIVQVDTQNRSAPYVQAAQEYVASGKLGDIGLVHVYNLKSGKPFILGESSSAPKALDWDMWLGPAPKRPFYEKIIRHGWLNFWDYCNGDLADDGIHQFDLALKVLGDPKGPGPVSSTGGRLVLEDDAETPDIQTAQYTYKDFVLTFEMTNYPRYMQKTTTTIRRNDEFPYWTQNSTRVEIYGSELLMTIGRHGGGWQVVTSGGKVVEQMYGRVPDNPHYKNFLDCVKSRKRPTADIRIAHNSLATLILAVVAHRVGNRTVSFDWENERFIDDDAGNGFMKAQGRGEYRMPKKI